MQDLELLATLPQLRSLSLAGRAIVVTGKVLPPASRLSRVDLSCCALTRDAMRPLAGSEQLTVLELSLKELADPFLLPLNGITSLRKLVISGQLIGDEGLQVIGSLTGLEELRLDISPLSPITAQGVASLRGLDALRELHLWGVPDTLGAEVSDLGASCEERSVMTGSELDAMSDAYDKYF